MPYVDGDSRRLLQAHFAQARNCPAAQKCPEAWTFRQRAPPECCRNKVVPNRSLEERRTRRLLVRVLYHPLAELARRDRA